MRVYALARELDIESKDLLDLCRQAGFEVKNQLSNLEPEQVDVVKELAKRGAKPATPPPAAEIADGDRLPEVGKAMPNLTSRPRRDGEAVRPSAAPVEATPPVPAAKIVEKPSSPTPRKQAGQR